MWKRGGKKQCMECVAAIDVVGHELSHVGGKKHVLYVVRVRIKPEEEGGGGAAVDWARGGGAALESYLVRRRYGHFATLHERLDAEFKRSLAAGGSGGGGSGGGSSTASARR